MQASPGGVLLHNAPSLTIEAQVNRPVRVKWINDLKDAATIYRTSVGPQQLDLYPGFVLTLPLDDTRTSKAVITKMTSKTLKPPMSKSAMTTLITPAI